MATGIDLVTMETPFQWLCFKNKTQFNFLFHNSEGHKFCFFDVISNISQSNDFQFSLEIMFGFIVFSNLLLSKN